MIDLTGYIEINRHLFIEKVIGFMSCDRLTDNDCIAKLYTTKDCLLYSIEYYNSSGTTYYLKTI